MRLTRSHDGSYRCPSCQGILRPVQATMHYRGRYFAGLVCYGHQTPALYDNPDDSMLAYAEECASLAARGDASEEKP